MLPAICPASTVLTKMAATDAMLHKYDLRYEALIVKILSLWLRIFCKSHSVRYQAKNFNNITKVKCLTTFITPLRLLLLPLPPRCL